MALQSGANADALTQLMDLQERWDKRQAEAAFNRAIQEFQSSCPPIAKNAKAEFSTKNGGRASYKFASLDHIAETIREPLKRLGLSYEFNSRSENQLMAVTCTVHHVDGHSRSSTFEVPIDSGNSLMSKPQQFGSALTFARRYALTMALGICTADPDTDAAERGEKLREKHASKSQPKPVTFGELKELKTRWNELNPQHTKEPEIFNAFVQWAAGILDVKPDILRDPSGWQPQDVDACWAELG